MADAIFIPGMMGSNLDVNEGGKRVKLWVGTARLAGGGFSKLRLNAAGDGPGAGGAPIFVGDWFNEAYQKPYVELNRQLSKGDWGMTTWQWDWRKDLSDAANKLLAFILERYDETRQATLVCHSAGGLIARLVYRYLKFQSKENRIRKIITLGTPHKGCFNPFLFWTFRNSDAKQLVKASRSLFGGTPYTYEQIADVTASWPSMYEMLPRLHEADLARDPNRPKLYDADNYPPGINIDQAWLDATKNEFLPLLLDPRSIPPGERLVTVGGQGIPTAYAFPAILPVGLIPGLLDLKLWQQNLLEDDRGDGSVTLDSALIPGSKQFTVNCDHSGLFQAGVYSGWLADLITEDVADDATIPSFGVDLVYTQRSFVSPGVFMNVGEFVDSTSSGHRPIRKAGGPSVKPRPGGTTGISVRPR